MLSKGREEQKPRQLTPKAKLTDRDEKNSNQKPGRKDNILYAVAKEPSVKSHESKSE